MIIIKNKIILCLNDLLKRIILFINTNLEIISEGLVV